MRSETTLDKSDCGCGGALLEVVLRRSLERLSRTAHGLQRTELATGGASAGHAVGANLAALAETLQQLVERPAPTVELSSHVERLCRSWKAERAGDVGLAIRFEGTPLLVAGGVARLVALLLIELLDAVADEVSASIAAPLAVGLRRDGAGLQLVVQSSAVVGDVRTDPADRQRLLRLASGLSARIEPSRRRGAAGFLVSVPDARILERCNAN